MATRRRETRGRSRAANPPAAAGEAPAAAREERDDALREDLSDLETEAQGGMRATEPGHAGDERVEEWIDEANAMEGHNLLGASSRREAAHDIGPHEELGFHDDHALEVEDHSTSLVDEDLRAEDDDPLREADDNHR